MSKFRTALATFAGLGLIISIQASGSNDPLRALAEACSGRGSPRHFEVDGAQASRATKHLPLVYSIRIGGDEPATQLRAALEKSGLLGGTWLQHPDMLSGMQESNTLRILSPEQAKQLDRLLAQHGGGIVNFEMTESPAGRLWDHEQLRFQLGKLGHELSETIIDLNGKYKNDPQAQEIEIQRLENALVDVKRRMEELIPTTDNSAPKWKVDGAQASRATKHLPLVYSIRIGGDEPAKQLRAALEKSGLLGGTWLQHPDMLSGMQESNTLRILSPEQAKQLDRLLAQHGGGIVNFEMTESPAGRLWDHEQLRFQLGKLGHELSETLIDRDGKYKSDPQAQEKEMQRLENASADVRRQMEELIPTTDNSAAH